MTTSEVLKRAAETINRLGLAAQDCASCDKLPLCNASKDDDYDVFHDCNYKWRYAVEAERLSNEES